MQKRPGSWRSFLIVFDRGLSVLDCVAQCFCRFFNFFACFISVVDRASEFHEVYCVSSCKSPDLSFDPLDLDRIPCFACDSFRCFSKASAQIFKKISHRHHSPFFFRPSRTYGTPEKIPVRQFIFIIPHSTLTSTNPQGIYTFLTVGTFCRTGRMKAASAYFFRSFIVLL